MQHYKNYQLGADEQAGEKPHYMNDLNSLLKNKEKEIQSKLDDERNQPKSKNQPLLMLGFRGIMEDEAILKCRCESWSLCNNSIHYFLVSPYPFLCTPA